MEDTLKLLSMDYFNLLINEQTSATSRRLACCSSTTLAHAAPPAPVILVNFVSYEVFLLLLQSLCSGQSRWCRRRGSPDRTVTSAGAGTPTAPAPATSPSTPSPPARSSSRRRPLHRRRSRSRVVELPGTVLIRVVRDKVFFRSVDGWKRLEKAEF
jgi:hypothetical protein